MSGSLRLIRPLAAAAALAALISCAPTPPKPGETAQGLEERAGEALEAQDYARAAELYDSAAERYEAPEARARAAIRAAEAWLEADQTDTAAQALRKVEEGLRGELDEPARTRLGLVRARLALAQGRTATADRYLERLPAPPEGHQAVYYTLRAQVAEQRGKRLEAVRQRVDLEAHLEAEAAREENRQAIWQLLTEAPGPLLRERADAASEDLLGGWLRLALLAREHRLAPRRLEEALRAWEARFPEHPAREGRVLELLTQSRERLQRPGHIALLLPLSGDFAAAAEAVRHGVLAAYYAAEGERPELRVYDTGGDGQQAVAAYRRAVEAGAEYTVGPLTKRGVAALAAEYEELPTPVLGLNTPAQAEGSRDFPEQLYRFGLSAEAEARQAARHALRQGWQRVLILTPESEWGERLGDAYAEAVEEHGGTVLQRNAYAADEADHSEILRELLRLDASRQRHRRLTRLLGEAPRFEPRRRRDADTLLIGALPRQARLLRPQIQYHRASGLPVVATSHAYGGTVQPDLDGDLEGMRFLDGPWLVDSAVVGIPRGLEHTYLSEQWPERMQENARLIALGIDAYRIIPYLGVMAEHPEERIDGLTGRLRLSEAGRVERRLVAARFADGRPVTEIQATEGQDGQQPREEEPQTAAP